MSPHYEQPEDEMKYLFTFAVAVSMIATVALAAQEIEISGAAIAYACEPGSENLQLINIAKRQAVINAEWNCSWDEGRPVLTRTSDWEVEVVCPREDSHDDWGDAYVKTTFSCN